MKLGVLTISLILSVILPSGRAHLEIPLQRYIDEPVRPIPCPDNNCSFLNLTNGIITTRLLSYLDIQYMIELSFGESQNVFKLLVDTGSSWIWIPGDGFFNDYEHLHYYDCAESDGCHQTGEMKPFYYGKGEILGEIVLGKMCLDQYNCIEDQHFVIANSQYDLDGLRGDGLLGLGSSQLMDNYTTFIENLYNLGIISELSFSLYLDGGTDRDHGTSALILGGYDSKYMRDPTFTFAPITDDLYWAVNLTKIKFGNLNVRMKNYKAVIDSGSSCLHFPPLEYRQIMNEIQKIADQYGPGKLIDYMGYLFFMPGDFDLNIFPSFKIQINRTYFEVESKDYIVNIEGICLIMIVATPVPDLVILGDAFMHRVYTYFDIQNKRIGFARNIPHEKLLKSEITFFEILVVVMAIFSATFFIREKLKNNKKAKQDASSEKIIELNKSPYAQNVV